MAVHVRLNGQILCGRDIEESNGSSTSVTDIHNITCAVCLTKAVELKEAGKPRPRTRPGRENLNLRRG